VRVGRSVLLGNLLLLALLASCGGRDENALGATDLGRFQPSPGSVLLSKAYRPKVTEYVTQCAEYTRVFGTNDVEGFQRALFEAARSAHWSADQSELPLALDGISDIFRGRGEVARLSFWSAIEPLQQPGTRPKPEDNHYQRWFGPSALHTTNVDWTVHRFAAVLEVFDGPFEGCEQTLTDGGVMRVAGRVTSSEAGLPVAGVKVWLYQSFPPNSPLNGVPGLAALTDGDGLYTFDVRDKYPVRGVSFDGGPHYLVTWWRDATSLETATALTKGSTRNVVFVGIDAKLQPVLP